MSNFNQEVQVALRYELSFAHNVSRCKPLGMVAQDKSKRHAPKINSLLHAEFSMLVKRAGAKQIQDPCKP